MTLMRPAELRTVRLIDADDRVVGTRVEYRIVLVDSVTGLISSQMSEWIPVDGDFVDERLPVGTTVDDVIANLPAVTIQVPGEGE